LYWFVKINELKIKTFTRKIPATNRHNYTQESSTANRLVIQKHSIMRQDFIMALYITYYKPRSYSILFTILNIKKILFSGILI